MQNTNMIKEMANVVEWKEMISVCDKELFDKFVISFFLVFEESILWASFEITDVEPVWKSWIPNWLEGLDPDQFEVMNLKPVWKTGS